MAHSPKIVGVVQARITSNRFPEKVMHPLSDEHTVISALLARLARSAYITSTVVAIPGNRINARLAKYVMGLGYEISLGDEFDVQSRFLEVAKITGADWLVRVTGDCPLIDPDVVDRVIELAIKEDLQYCSNVSPPTFPDGLDVEVFRPSALQTVRELGPSNLDLEHVTWTLRESGRFATNNLFASRDVSHLSWSIDEPGDLERMRKNLPIDFMHMGWEELASNKLGLPEFEASRNEGMNLSAGQKVWKRAKKVIPGGAMLLSKSPEMYLPEQWPTYYSKARGIEVWDLDGNKYVDFSTMSVGACSLGYGNLHVDDAVKNAVEEGVMSSLNSPEEVTLAEKLVDMHPWASMVRFARTGGEANAIATRIARAHTGKDKVAVCGYHGWHDWYLAANLDADSNLDGHLLPGLQPKGVPRGLQGTSVPFAYNDIKHLESLLRTRQFAAVQMEVIRNFGPENNFLKKVRELCTEYGAILIFDECTSGFRESFGGLHLNFPVSPDLAMFGKALGNGYAITAVIGVETVMQAAQDTFISSTFWTERIGTVAALATIEEMFTQRSWEKLPQVGAAIKSIWRNAFEKHGLDYKISGIDALPTFTLGYPHWPVLRTLLSQEMLDRGFLASSSFYASTCHTESQIQNFQTAFFQSVETLANNFDEISAAAQIRGAVAQTGFKRLN